MDAPCMNGAGSAHPAEPVPICAENREAESQVSGLRSDRDPQSGWLAGRFPVFVDGTLFGLGRAARPSHKLQLISCHDGMDHFCRSKRRREPCAASSFWC